MSCVVHKKSPELSNGLFCGVEPKRVIYKSLYFLTLLIIVAAMNPLDNLFSQYSYSQPVLLTPNTNDLDGVSGLRAIAPPTNTTSEPYPPYTHSINQEQNRQYRQYNYEKDRQREREFDQDNYQNDYSYRRDNYRTNRNEPNTYTAQDNPPRNTPKQPENQTRTQPQTQLQTRPDNTPHVAHLPNIKPSPTLDRDSQELINSSLNIREIGSDSNDVFSSNRVIPSGVVGQNSSPQIDTTPSYKDDLPNVKVCGVVVVQANFPLKEVELQLVEIENLQRDLNTYLGLPAPKEKIELCLFRDEASYMKFITKRFANAPRDRRALYIKKGNEAGTVLVQRLKDFEIDLRHEMTHAIVHASIPVVPIWLDEGLAKYFEQLPQDRFSANPYIKQVRKNMKFGTIAVPSLWRLEKLSVASDMGDSEYRDSWAWVHFLFHHSEKTHRMLAGYLKLLATLPQNKYKNKDGNVKVPNLSLYIDDYVENPRQQFKKHFLK
jgi:hypothetical protein